MNSVNSGSTNSDTSLNLCAGLGHALEVAPVKTC